jgi:hypothetical protein
LPFFFFPSCEIIRAQKRARVRFVDAMGASKQGLGTETDKNYLKAPATKRPPQARTRSQRITGA